jgi:membrane protein implicated in regulation of membrane protease activity
VSWQDFYLVCFVLGFALALLAFLSGAFHWPLGHGGWIAHLFGHAGTGTGAHGPSGASPLNAGSVMAFLAWFGGVGYLLSRGGTWPHLLVLFAAAAAGVAGALLVFFFLAKVLIARERPLDAADFHMEGVLGRVTVGIRPGGTGEVLYSQGGTRRSAGARSESGEAVPRGAEVVVTRYENGIAYVRLWEELAGEVSEVGRSKAEEGRS